MAMANACVLFTEPPAPHNERSFSGKFELAVAKKRGNKEPVVVEVAQLTDFDWDRMFVFAPYTDVKTVHKTLGYEWRGAEVSQIERMDRFHLLVFTKDSKVVKYFEYPRGGGHFNLNATEWSGGLSKDAAVFSIDEEIVSGEPLLLITPVRKS